MLVLMAICFIFLKILFFLVFFWTKWMNRKSFSSDREKSSSFECGFDGNKSKKKPFSFRFFYLLMIFLIFDMELSLFLVLPFNLLKFNIFLKLVVILCLVVLIVGLMEEWRRGTLKWKF